MFLLFRKRKKNFLFPLVQVVQVVAPTRGADTVPTQQFEANIADDSVRQRVAS